MRLVTSALILAAAAATPAYAQTSGAYATISARVADDCVKPCQNDGLCVGWTFEGGICSLWANVPEAVSIGFTLSPRAPHFAHQVRTTRMQQSQLDAAPLPVAQVAEIAAAELLGGEGAPQDLRPRFGDD